MVSVTAVREVGGFRLWLEFDDGTRGEVDLETEPWGEMFEPLRAVELFSRAELDEELETVCRPNGADLAPESLRERLEAKDSGGTLR
jgi:hypothetical protein